MATDSGGISDNPKILVIRRDNIGDLVCTTPLIRALRERFPNGRICALVNSYNAPILEFNPDVDEIYAYTKAKHRPEGQSVSGVYWERLRLMLRLRRERFDYAIIGGAHFLPRALRLARMVKAKHIIGFTEPGYRKARRIDMGVPYSLPTAMHEVEDVFRLLEPLGINGAPPKMRVVPNPGEFEQARLALAHKGVSSDGMIIGVHISARKPCNRWPVEHFVALIKALHERYSSAFVLFWSPGSDLNPLHPGDDEKAQAIVEATQGLPVVPYPTERLGELVGGLAQCPYVICSDGGAMHIAAALGAALVCFFGGTDKTRWYPWGARHILLQPGSRQVSDIDVQDALKAFAEIAEQSHHPYSREA
jgi:heptosyltransferase-3